MDMGNSRFEFFQYLRRKHPDLYWKHSTQQQMKEECLADPLQFFKPRNQ